MRRFLGLFAALAAVSALLALSAGQAVATTVHCGDVITQNTTLDADLLGCSGPALSIHGQGQDVALDLNGHTVESSTGATIRATADGLPGTLTVKNGVLLGSFGVDHGTADLRNLIVSGTARFCGTGVAFFKGSQGAVSNTLIEDCSTGFDTAHAGDINISNTSIRDNGTGLAAGQGGSPRLTNSSITDNAQDGVVLSQAGIELTRSLIARNGGYGVDAFPGGVSSQDSSIVRNGAGGLKFSEGGGFTMLRTTISRNGGDGILALEYVRAALTNSRIDRNLGDGVHAFSPNPFVTPSLTITGSHTWFNGNLGIETVTGTVGGGNSAKHNGNPLQCVPTTLCITTGKPKG